MLSSRRPFCGSEQRQQQQQPQRLPLNSTYALCMLSYLVPTSNGSDTSRISDHPTTLAVLSDCVPVAQQWLVLRTCNVCVRVNYTCSCNGGWAEFCFVQKSDVDLQVPEIQTCSFCKVGNCLVRCAPCKLTWSDRVNWRWFRRTIVNIYEDKKWSQNQCHLKIRSIEVIWCEIQ